MKTKIIIIMTLFLLSYLTGCKSPGRIEECYASCDQLQKDCLSRIHDAEKCGFASMDCRWRCRWL